MLFLTLLAPSSLHCGYDPLSVRAAAPPLQFDSIPHYSGSIRRYFRYYRLDSLPAQHYFGFFTRETDTCMAHVFMPDSARGTLFLLHGYYDHTGTMRNLIHYGIKKKYCVAAFDLPGHGLSNYPRASIDTFHHYILVVKRFLSISTARCPPPYICIGHSTGGAIVLEYCFTHDTIPFSRVILLAPLVRGAYWHFSKFGYYCSRPFVDRTPRWFRNASSDEDFLTAFHADPLQIDYFPLQWASALYEWEKKTHGYAPRPLPFHVIQGTKDNVVDWRYNIPFIRKKVPTVTITFIQGARHQLINESDSLRSACFDSIDHELKRSRW
jgi:lysophospholipase